MESKVKPSVAELRKMAVELRKKAEEIRTEKMVKSAKFVVGLTAMVQLQNKLRSKLNG